MKQECQEIGLGRGGVPDDRLHELDSIKYLEAMTLVMKHRLSVYDASYHVQPNRLGCRFLTLTESFGKR